MNDTASMATVPEGTASGGSDGGSAPVVEGPPRWRRPHPPPLRFRTERLEVRAYEAADAEALLDAATESRDDLSRWLPWPRTENRTLGECHYTIERFRRIHKELAPDMVTFGIFEAASGRLVGGVGFHDIERRLHAAEIGWWARVSARGHGYITEAARALLALMLVPQGEGGWGFSRVSARVAAPNLSSIAVAQRIGLIEEGRHRLAMWLDADGRAVDAHLFALVGPDAGTLARVVHDLPR